MTLTGRDIVCLSTHYWDERRFRKQEFMSRFARNNRVLFVEPSFSMLRRPEVHLASHANNRFFVTRVLSREAGLHLLQPPRGLPRWSRPRVQAVTYTWYGRLIAQAMRRLGFRDAILWVYQPAYVHALGVMPHRNLVFDMVDDLSAYSEGGQGAAHLEGAVGELVRQSDLLVVTAKTLDDRYRRAAKQTIQIPNGVNTTRFAAPSSAPPELASIKRPILGFIGTLFEFLDYDLLTRVAIDHGDKSLVLLGPIELSARARAEQLMRLPNVHHLGSVDQQAIASFVAQFDVCLNVFQRGRLADSVIPLKVFEYVAAGKPVVSTRMVALEREPIATEICFPASEESFSQAIERLLHSCSPEDVRRRRAVAANYSWERLFVRLESGVEAALR